MSIKPVDFQLSVPRALEVSKIREEHQQKDLSQQQNQIQHTNQSAEKSYRQVQKDNKAENLQIQEKNENKNKNKKENKNSNDSSENTEEKKKNNEEKKTCTFDVRI